MLRVHCAPSSLSPHLLDYLASLQESTITITAPNGTSLTLPWQGPIHFSDSTVSSESEDTPEPESNDREDDSHRMRTGGLRCFADVVRIIKDTGHRLTTSQLLSALAGIGSTWSESHVKHVLSEAVELGLLTNFQRADPRGYGLSEWPE